MVSATTGAPLPTDSDGALVADRVPGILDGAPNTRDIGTGAREPHVDRLGGHVDLGEGRSATFKLDELGSAAASGRNDNG